MQKKIILLSGVHGVGKGYFLKEKFENDNRFEILGASSLISKYKKADDAGYKKVQNVSNNQQILLTALSIEKNKINKDIILDGHICMINAEGKVESIPEKFFLDAESYYKTKMWYRLSQYYYDCSNKTFVAKSGVFYDLKGNPIQYTTLEDYNLSFISVVPGTIGDKMYDYVCTGRF